MYENVSPSSNSDSGIFKDSAGATGGVVIASPDTEDFNAEESFNTERLEHQNR